MFMVSHWPAGSTLFPGAIATWLSELNRNTQGLLSLVSLSACPWIFWYRVSHILNMAREIDNFYPERFTYHNVRLWDEESAQLLPHWKETHRFIEAARSAPLGSSHWLAPAPERPRAFLLPVLPSAPCPRPALFLQGPEPLSIPSPTLQGPQGQEGLGAHRILPLQSTGHPGAGALQDGRQPLGCHGAGLCHEAVRLEPGAGSAPCAGAPAHCPTKPWLSAPAADLPGHPDCQV